MFVGTSILLALALYGYSEPTGKTVSQPSVADVAKAVEQLKSSEVTELLAAAKVICRSDDEAAWQALRQALADEEVLKRLEARHIDFGQEGGPTGSAWPDLALMMKTIAEGESGKAGATLMWLVQQKPYVETYRTEDENDKSWRLYLVCDAFQYIQEPSKELLEFCRQKLESKTFQPELKSRISEALAAYGTHESLDVLQKTGGASLLLLIRHRNNYECIRLFFDIYRKATVADYAHAMLERLFAESYVKNKFWPPVVLPKISPQGEEAKKFIDLLNGFLADPGKIALTEDEIKNIKNLIASIEEGNKTPVPPTPEEIAKAVEQLKSDKVEELIAAASAICRSDDEAAWQALRQALADEEVLKRLEARVIDFIEGGPMDKTWPDLAQMMKTVTEGTSDKASAALMWLVEQKPYAETYRNGDNFDKPWRSHLAYDAFQYIQRPSKELIDFCRQKLESKTFEGALKNRIMEALAAYGTPESMDLFKAHLWHYGGDPILLVKHRNHYECVRFLIDIYREVKGDDYAHEMLDMLFAETYQESRFWPEVVLPKIAPQGEEAKKFVDLLNGFLADPGKIALTEDETAKIKGLIASIETANKPKTNLRTIIGRLFHIFS